MTQPLLTDLRAAIQEVDSTIITLLAERTALARAVGQVKAELGQPVTDPAREAAVVSHAVSLAREAGLPEEDIRQLYWHVVGLSRRAQIG